MIWQHDSVQGRQLVEELTIADSSVVPIEKLLIEHWQPGRVARAAADKIFADANPKDRAIVLAFTAHRLNDFVKLDYLQPLSDLLNRDPNFLDGWLIRAHLNLFAKEFDRSLMDLRTAGRLIARLDLSDEQRQEIFYQVGRMIGYLQGPVAHWANQDLILAVQDQYRGLAEEKQWERFEQGVVDILTEFQQNVNEANQVLTAEFEQEERKDQVKDQMLTQENETLQIRLGDLNQQLAATSNQFAMQEAQLTGQLSPLQSNLVSIENQIQSMQWQRNRLYTDLFLLQSDPYCPPFSINLVLNQIRSIEFSLAGLHANYRNQLGQINGLQWQLQQLQSQRNSETRAIQSQLRRSARRLSDNQKELARIATGPVIPLRTRKSVQTQVTVLKNYIPYSHDLLRQQILEILGRR